MTAANFVSQIMRAGAAVADLVSSVGEDDQWYYGRFESNTTTPGPALRTVYRFARLESRRAYY
jgi:hypothetical protein